MITYEKYAEIRDSKGLTDGKVAEMAGFGRSTFSDWKSGRSVPKADKMQRIANALGMQYSDFLTPDDRLSAYIEGIAGIQKLRETSHQMQEVINQQQPAFKELQNQLSSIDKELLELYHNATADAQKIVMAALKTSQKEDSESSKEA